MLTDSPYWDADRATYEDELNAFVRRTHPDPVPMGPCQRCIIETSERGPFANSKPCQHGKDTTDVQD